MALRALGQGQGFLKAGFLGFPKSGKTFTATLLATAVRDLFALKGPIAMFDTEGGSEYVGPIVKAKTGLELVGVRSRSFDDLLSTGRDAEAEGDSVLIADSLTHVWRELCAAYLANVNAHRRQRNLPPRTKLEFQDWGRIKERWAAWTDFYLNSQLHVIVCGRAGYEFDFERNEETGQRDLVKTGVKMKTETEFGFEPSLLVQMEQLQELPEHRRKGKTVVKIQPTVIGDRFSVIAGQQALWTPPNTDKPKELEAACKAVFTFFEPHLRRLKPGASSTIDTAVKSDLGVDENGDGDWQRERRERAILAEEIQGEIAHAYPGQTAAEKKAKADLLFLTFGTRSWTKVSESTSSPELRRGLAEIRRLLAETAPGGAGETERFAVDAPTETENAAVVS